MNIEMMLLNLCKFILFLLHLYYCMIVGVGKCFFLKLKLWISKNIPLVACMILFSKCPSMISPSIRLFVRCQLFGAYVIYALFYITYTPPTEVKVKVLSSIMLFFGPYIIYKSRDLWNVKFISIVLHKYTLEHLWNSYRWIWYQI